MPGWSRMASHRCRDRRSPGSPPPAAGPASRSTSKASCWVSGTCSEGLSTNVFPQAMANGRNQNGTIAGKLNGTIAAHTPTGCLTVSQSTPRATSSSTRPASWWAPRRRTPPSRSSAPPRRARRRSSCPSPRSPTAPAPRACECSPSRRANRRLPRSITLTSRHAGSAARAAATAASRSDGGGQRNAGQGLAGGGVCHVQRALGRRWHPAAADVVVDQPRRRAHGGVHRLVAMLRLGRLVVGRSVVGV